jgi:hypothetical protein
MELKLGEPEHVNEVGVKWWTHALLTEWASRPDQNGIVLNDYKVWIVQVPSGEKSLLLTSKDKLIFETKRVEDMACRIDFIKLDVNYSSKNL